MRVRTNTCITPAPFPPHRSLAHLHEARNCGAWCQGHGMGKGAFNCCSPSKSATMACLRVTPVQHTSGIHMARRTTCFKPYMCPAGRVLISVATKCATHHITVCLLANTTTVSPGLDPTAAAMSSSRALQPQQQQQQPQLQCQVVIECLVLSVWDDERRRLLGGNAGCRPALDPALAPAELCCVYWDGLTAEVTRQQAASTGRPSAPCLLCIHS